MIQAPLPRHEIGLMNIFINELHITSFVIMWEGLFWYWLPQKLTERLPAFFDIPDKKVLFRDFTFDVKIM